MYICIYLTTHEKESISKAISENQLSLGTKNSTAIDSEHNLLAAAICDHKAPSIHHMGPPPNHKHSLRRRTVQFTDYGLHRARLPSHSKLRRTSPLCLFLSVQQLRIIKFLCCLLLLAITCFYTQNVGVHLLKRKNIENVDFLFLCLLSGLGRRVWQALTREKLKKQES